MQIKKELQKNKQVMQEAFRDCGDIIMREFRIRGGEGTLFLAYTDNIVNGDAIQNFIMTNVMARCEMQGTESDGGGHCHRGADKNHHDGGGF